MPLLDLPDKAFTTIRMTKKAAGYSLLLPLLLLFGLPFFP